MNQAFQKGELFSRLCTFALDRRRACSLIAIALAVLCCISSEWTLVGENPDALLPESTRGLAVMEAEFSAPGEGIAGEIMIGCGETQIMREIAKVAIRLQRDYPGIRFNLYSANADDVSEKLDQGLLDFGLMFEPFDMGRYDTLLLPFSDTIGVLMQENHPLAGKKSIRLADVEGVPMIMPSQGQFLASSGPMTDVFRDTGRLNIVCYYNLLFNAAVMVEQGMGIACCLEHLADTSEHTRLTFRPADPPMVKRPRLAWKKNQVFSPAAELFLMRIRQQFEPGKADSARDGQGEKP